MKQPNYYKAITKDQIAQDFKRKTGYDISVEVLHAEGCEPIFRGIKIHEIIEALPGEVEESPSD